MSSDSSHCSILNGPPCCPDYGIECKYLPFCRKIVKYLINETTHPDDNKDYQIFSLVLLDTDLNFRSSELFGIVVQLNRTSVMILTNGGEVVYRLKRQIQMLRLNMHSYEWKMKLMRDVEESSDLRKMVLLRKRSKRSKPL